MVLGDAMTGDGIPSKTMALPLCACEVTPYKLSILLALDKQANQSKDPALLWSRISAAPVQQLYAIF